MTAIEFISLLASFASLILAGVAIWLALYHKKEADSTNLLTRDLMLEIRSDAKSVTNIAVPEMRAYGDAMRQMVLKGPNEKYLESELGGSQEISDRNSEPEDLVDSLNDLVAEIAEGDGYTCLLYTSPSPRDLSTSRMPSSA